MIIGHFSFFYSWFLFRFNERTTRLNVSSCSLYLDGTREAKISLYPHTSGVYMIPLTFVILFSLHSSCFTLLYYCGGKRASCISTTFRGLGPHWHPPTRR